MDRSTPIDLIAVTKSQDDRGVWRETQTSRQVFAHVKSATASEFFQGGKNGLKPVYVFEVFLPDYKEEPLVKFNGKIYSIYRSYIKDNVDIIELHVQLKTGTQA